AQVERSDQYDPDSTPDNDVPSEDDQDDAVLNARVAAIVVEKTVTPGSSGRNAPITYTIRITNTGDVTLDPVSLVDTLPTDLHYVGPGSPSDPDVIAEPLLTWVDLGSLDSGESLTVTFPVTATPGIAGTYWNVVTATGTTPGGPVTDTDTVPVDIEDPAIDLDKEIIGIDTDIVAPNYVTFTVAITNVGLTTIDVLPLLDQYNPTYLSFHDATPYPDEDADDGLLTWYDLTTAAPNGFGFDLTPSQSVLLTTVFRVASDINITTTNVVTVTGATDIYDYPANDDDDEVPVWTEGDPGIPTPIEVLYLAAEAVESGAAVEWATAAEIDLLGFYIYRAGDSSFGGAQVVGYVSAEGGGSSYEYIDGNVVPGEVYWYWLVEAVGKGEPDTYGPAYCGVGLEWLPYRVYLPMVVSGRASAAQAESRSRLAAPPLPPWLRGSLWAGMTTKGLGGTYPGEGKGRDKHAT
ncbi:MAG: DUF11 domain-containing protein, partial [Anaerolineales bacterium]